MTNEQQIKILCDEIKKFGIKSGDTIMMHSSLSSLGYIEGGATSVIKSFLEVLGKKGTLLMPALSYENVGDFNPEYSANDTPCCVGTIPEAFRKFPGTIRSLHPTHSIAANGFHAKDLTEMHILDRTPVGDNSPLSLIRKYNGKILMLGCGLLHNTSMHGVEETVVPPYLFMNKKTSYTLKDADGKIYHGEYTNHNFEGFEQRYDRIKDLLNSDEIKCGKILEAECYLIDSKALWEKGNAALQKNKLYFVDSTSEN